MQLLSSDAKPTIDEKISNFFTSRYCHDPSNCQPTKNTDKKCRLPVPRRGRHDEMRADAFILQRSFRVTAVRSMDSLWFPSVTRRATSAVPGCEPITPPCAGLA